VKKPPTRLWRSRLTCSQIGDLFILSWGFIVGGINTWIPYPRPARLCFVARNNFCKLYVHCDTTTRCVIIQKSAVRSYIAAEAWNHVCTLYKFHNNSVGWILHVLQFLQVWPPNQPTITVLALCQKKVRRLRINTSVYSGFPCKMSGFVLYLPAFKSHCICCRPELSF